MNTPIPLDTPPEQDIETLLRNIWNALNLVEKKELGTFMWFQIAIEWSSKNLVDIALGQIEKLPREDLLSTIKDVRLLLDEANREEISEILSAYFALHNQ